MPELSRNKSYSDIHTIESKMTYKFKISVRDIVAAKLNKYQNGVEGYFLPTTKSFEKIRSARITKDFKDQPRDFIS